MRAEEEVFSTLATTLGVTAIVSQRIYPNNAAQDTPLPLIVYERRSSQPINTIHDGVPVASIVSISASAWAKTQIAAEELADQMLVAMRGIATSVNRFGHYDGQTTSHAAVIDFELLELP